MPVSDFIWSVEAPQLHNGGMKRKISGDACSVESQEQMIKRRCTVISAGGDSNMCNVDDENHNEMASQNLNNAAVQQTTLIDGMTLFQSSMQTTANMIQGQQQLTCSGFQSQQTHNPSTVEYDQRQTSPEYQPQQAQSDQQNNMIMDLNDEIYSNSYMPTDEEMASSYMDSDFVPNQQQYNVRGFDNHTPMVGESISAMDRVKCYCRPSWEGMLEMKPYVSDYY